MRACKNAAFRNGFSALLLRTDESARVYAPAERCYCLSYTNSSFHRSTTYVGFSSQGLVEDLDVKGSALLSSVSDSTPPRSYLNPKTWVIPITALKGVSCRCYYELNLCQT